jgi:predicted phage-related endonuclease
MVKIYRDIRLKQGTTEWKKFREESGIGGSEIASVLATDSKELADLVYTSPLKLFLQKIGEPHLQKFTGNLKTEEGHFQETSIIERFKYYDLEQPDAYLMHLNRREGKVLNRVIRPNGVFHSKQWEWMYYSPDGLWLKPERKRFGILESKLTTSMETNRYVNKVNPSHYLQVQYGLKITGLTVGYILLLIDGQWFEPIKVEPDPEIHQWIEQISAQFWYKVASARKIKIEYGIPAYFQMDPERFTERQREGIQLLQELEPSLIGSEHEVKFIREMIVPQSEEMPREGSQDEWELALQYLKINDDIKASNATKNEVLAKILHSLNGSNVINFNEGKSGYYSYKPDKNGKPSIYVSPKLRQ